VIDNETRIQETNMNSYVSDLLDEVIDVNLAIEYLEDYGVDALKEFYSHELGLNNPLVVFLNDPGNEDRAEELLEVHLSYFKAEKKEIELKLAITKRQLGLGDEPASAKDDGIDDDDDDYHDHLESGFYIE
jgi:hypothetical protein